MYLLSDFASELCAVGLVWSVGVDWDNEVWKLSVDEIAQGRQTEKDGEES